MLSTSSTASTTDGLFYDSDFNVSIFGNILPWIDIIDNLRDIGVDIDDVSLPQIVVVGDQSSGKSSVLEALSGIEFPRGSGIVTRCPTEVKMKRASEWRGTIKVTGENFGASEVVKSPKEISRRIEELTQKLTCSEKAIETNRSIQIEVFSPDVCDLTIIDLPGIVRWRMDGQSETVVQDVDSLLQRYLVQPRTVILAVIPSNVDIATVDIIERASKVDPGFRRTIGVFTKPDKADSGQLREKIKILKGSESSIQLRCTMLRNRGPEEIEAGVSLDEAKRIETNYFKTQLEFKTVDPSLLGIDHCRHMLSVLLAQNIKESLPDLQNEITTKSQAAAEELAGLGDAPPSDKESRLAIINKLLKSVTDDIRDSAKEGSYNTEVLLEKRESRICANFRTLANDCQNEIIQGISQLDVADLQNRLAERRGWEVCGSHSHNVFTMFIREIVGSWKKPVMKLLDSTAELIMQACHIIIGYHAQNFKAIEYDLKKFVVDVVAMKHKEAKTSVALKHLFDRELMPNPVNPMFAQLQDAESTKRFQNFLSDAFKKCPNNDIEKAEKIIIEEYGKSRTSGSESNDKKEAEWLRRTLEAYWTTRAPAFVDNAISTIRILLLEELHDEVSKEFYKEFYTRANGNDCHYYFYESEEIKFKREKLQKTIGRVEAAKKTFRHMKFGY